MRTQFAIFMIILAGLLAAATGCHRGGAEDEISIPKEQALAAREVKVAAVGRRDFARSFRATGSLQPRDQARLRALLDGPLDEVSAEIGRTVKEGDPLFRTRQADANLSVQNAEAALKTATATMEEMRAWKRSEEVRMLEADLEQAESEAARLEAERKRQKALFDSKIIPASMYDAAASSADTSKARVEKMKAALDIAKKGPTAEQINTVKAQVAQAQSATGQAKQMLKDTTVRAPYRGVITAKLMRAGDYARKADEVVEIANLDVLQAEMHIPERFALLVKEGLPVEIVVESANTKREGQVVAVGDAIEPRTRTFLVKVEVENRDNAIKAGAFCLGMFHLPAVKGQIAVPAPALLNEEGRSFVWVADGGKARRAFVRTGEQDKDFVEILEGLSGNESVVVEGYGALAEGDDLKIGESAAPQPVASAAGVKSAESR